MRCVTQLDGQPITETKASKLSNFVSKVTIIVRRDSTFEKVNYVLNFGAVFDKEYVLSLLAAQMVDIVENVFLSDFLTSNSLRKYQLHI